MDQEHREKLKEAAKRRGNCPQCGASKYNLKELDGSEVGGLPGITYRYCGGCGWTQAKTKRQRKFKL